jgi:NAD(P)-dependent dehydrogenase (short-subunit alcohol dehydrogenase family)
LRNSLTIFTYIAETHMPVQMDVTNSDNIADTIEKVIDKYKRPPTIIVNSAGITRDGFLLKMDESDFELVVKVNLEGTFLVMKNCVKRMIDYKVGGSIVNISSVTARMGNMGMILFFYAFLGVC